MSMYKITSKTSTDPYMNINRDWRIEKSITDTYVERLVVHSGTDGVAIATKSSNNGFIHLDEETVIALIKELSSSIAFSKDAKADMAAYWRIKNSTYDLSKTLSNKWTKKSDD